MGRISFEIMFLQKPHSGESTNTVRVVNYQPLAVMPLKLPNGQLKVAVDHRQLRTKVSETVDPIDLHMPLAHATASY